MTHIIGKRKDRDEAMAEIKRIIDRHIIVGATPEQVQQINEHMNWHQRNPDDLRVNCMLETVPELQMTRITIELTNQPVRPLGKINLQ